MSSVSLLVLASPQELQPSERIWGTGGWLRPQRREALDWLTLGRLSGWEAIPYHVLDEGPPSLPAAERIVVGIEPEAVPPAMVAELERCLARGPLLVIARAASAPCPLADLAGARREEGTVWGRRLEWCGPGATRRWICRNPVGAGRIGLAGDARAWSSLDGETIIAARRVGRGTVVTLGFHPSEARDRDGAMTALLRHLLVHGPTRPCAWLDLEGTLVLRMDDPGGAPNVHHRDWLHFKLDGRQWSEIGVQLGRRGGRLSIAYVPAWVDDGDLERGELLVDDQPPARLPGAVYPSPSVTYRAYGGPVAGLHDYRTEFQGIESLRRAGLAGVELHGFTHMYPDGALWAAASDRYEAERWFRDLGAFAAPLIERRPRDEHPLSLGIAALKQFFDTIPTTLVCPGEQWTADVLERAADLRFHLVGSYYLAIADGDRFWWCTHVCAPYLDRPEAPWFDHGLPVVGYFHDRDVAVNGLPWLTTSLDQWDRVGAGRLMDYRELAGALSYRIRLRDGPRLVLEGRNGLPLVRPLPVLFTLGDGRLPVQIEATVDGSVHTLTVERHDNSTGRVIVPATRLEPGRVGTAV